MTTLSQNLVHYLTFRRSFGYDLAFVERVLRQFTQFADGVGHRHITTDLFLAWKANYGAADNSTWAARLGMVRNFAGWLTQHDVRTEIPPAGLVAGRRIRSHPYIFAKGEIDALIGAAGQLPSPYGLRALVWQTLFGLVAVTGMRISEALKLEQNDIDFGCELLSVRKSKNGKGRVIPLLSCTVDRLAIYTRERERLLGSSGGPFFVKEDGTACSDCGARYTFAQISRHIGLRQPTQYNRNGIGPRIHDLRHTFAVHTILDWFREGRDIDREMYRLSTYLGHTKPDYTFWYIEAVPELLEMASTRAEKRYLGDSV